MISSNADTSVGLGAQIHWSDQVVHIKDFSSKHPIPNVIKVVKGQYRNIGVSKSVSNELYLHSVQTVSKVLAESIKLKDGKAPKLVVSDQKYSLPVSYKGWFELLSQDGKSIKAILSIQELARFYPSSCLVRENIKGFIHQGTGDLSSDRTRTVLAGEVLNLVGEIWAPFQIGKVKAKRRILKCIDGKGEEVFFALDQKGTFSPIAGQNNISGVHSIKGLLDKFRLPLLVRLVHGVIPTKMEKGFSGVFRLVNIYSDENAFMCPLKKDTKMVPVSTRETLKIVGAANYNQLSSLEDFRNVQKKCSDMLESYLNSIHILITMPDSTAMMKGKVSLQSVDVEINLSSDIRTDSKQVSQNNNNVTGAKSISEEEEDLLFQEIDGIYQYVREGGLPPAPKVRSQKPKDGVQVLDTLQRVHDDPSVEIKMQQLDLPAEEEELDRNHYRSSLPRKDSYNWEEPIYEPLDKIREQKRKMAEKSDKSVVTGFDTPPENAQSSDDSVGHVNGNKIDITIGPPPVPVTPISRPSNPSQPSPVELNAPVSSLRQVIKSGGFTDTPRPKSTAYDSQPLADQAPGGYKAAPPLPPKRYNSQEHDRTIQNKTNPSGNSYNTSSSSGSSNSAQPLDKKLRHSMSSPAVIHPSVPSAHPPYVAVARVGDYQPHNTSATVVINPTNYGRRTSVGTEGRPKPNIEPEQKLHSMYL